MKTLNLTKPAIEYTSQERRQLFASLVKAVMPPRSETKLNSYQVAWAKGRAWKLMQEAGF